LFRIADLRVVWILADLFGEEAGAVKAGATARISVPDRPGYALMATVAPSQPQYDAVSRVTKLRLESPNPELILRPDMFVTVEFSIPMSNVTSVPAEAVVDSGSRKTVFVESGNGLFEARPVQTGVRFDNRVQITSGLQPGEPIVVSGNFLLDSESWMRSAPTNRPARPPDTAQLAGHGAPRHD
jgi:RND family efflux transporter MFP subunit